jgi:hypothetical protein
VSSSIRRSWNAPARSGQAALLIALLAAGSLSLRAATPAETERKIDALLAKITLVSFTPEYPFGYGLSYTQFEYTNLRVSAPGMALGGSLTVSADVANTGGVEADEIVQLYARQMVASLARPVRQLKGFRRVHLKPGEKQSVEFILKSGDLAFHKGAQLVTEPGIFQVWTHPTRLPGHRASLWSRRSGTDHRLSWSVIPRKKAAG